MGDSADVLVFLATFPFASQRAVPTRATDDACTYSTADKATDQVANRAANQATDDKAGAAAGLACKITHRVHFAVTDAPT